MTTSTQVRAGSYTYSAIWVWFFVSSLLVTWDIGYCVLRPRSMPGGDLHWIWSPYVIYSKIDKIYGFEALENKNGFTMAQTTMNIFETMLNFWYCYLGSDSPTAPLIGWTAASLTLAKTILYGLQEYFCEYCSVGHNTLHDVLVLWILPNSLWIVFPTIICYILGKDLVQSLKLANHVGPAKAKVL